MVKSLVDQIKLLLNVFRLLFQILVEWDTISDWPLFVSKQLFYSLSLPTRILSGNTACDLFLIGLPHLATKEFILPLLTFKRDICRKSWRHQLMTNIKLAPPISIRCVLPYQAETQSFHTIVIRTISLTHHMRLWREVSVMISCDRLLCCRSCYGDSCQVMLLLSSCCQSGL